MAPYKNWYHTRVKFIKRDTNQGGKHCREKWGKYQIPRRGDGQQYILYGAH